MKNVLFFVIVALLLVPVTASAATFYAEGEISRTVDKQTGQATVTVAGGNLDGQVQYLEQCRYKAATDDELPVPIRHEFQGNSVTFDSFSGDQFNILNKAGRYIYASPESKVATYTKLRLRGIKINCTDADIRGGCYFQLE